MMIPKLKSRQGKHTTEQQQTGGNKKKGKGRR